MTAKIESVREEAELAETEARLQRIARVAVVQTVNLGKNKLPTLVPEGVRIIDLVRSVISKPDITAQEAMKAQGVETFDSRFLPNVELLLTSARKEHFGSILRMT